MFQQLRASVEKSTAMFDKEKAQERLSKLSGGVAVFKASILYLVYTLLPCLFYSLHCKSSSSFRLGDPARWKLEKGKIELQML